MDFDDKNVSALDEKLKNHMYHSINFDPIPGKSKNNTFKTFCYNKKNSDKNPKNLVSFIDSKCTTEKRFRYKSHVINENKSCINTKINAENIKSKFVYNKNLLNKDYNNNKSLIKNNFKNSFNYNIVDNKSDNVIYLKESDTDFQDEKVINNKHINKICNFNNKINSDIIVLSDDEDDIKKHDSFHITDKTGYTKKKMFFILKTYSKMSVINLYYSISHLKSFDVFVSTQAYNDYGKLIFFVVVKFKYPKTIPLYYFNNMQMILPQLNLGDALDFLSKSGKIYLNNTNGKFPKLPDFDDIYDKNKFNFYEYNKVNNFLNKNESDLLKKDNMKNYDLIDSLNNTAVDNIIGNSSRFNDFKINLGIGVSKDKKEMRENLNNYNNDDLHEDLYNKINKNLKKKDKNSFIPNKLNDDNNAFVKFLGKKHKKGEMNLSDSESHYSDSLFGFH